MKTIPLISIVTTAAALAVGCSESGSHADHDHDHSSHTHAHVEGHGHVHAPPNGGTPVVLGNESFHVEFVAQATNKLMEAYILDGHLDEYVRLTIPSFEVRAQLSDRDELLQFGAVTNLSTGETVGDTAFFRADADWLEATPEFDAEIISIQIRSNRFENVSFHFPKGNDSVH